MQEVISAVRRWRNDGQAVALATVVRTWGSAPRQTGAKMALTAGGQMAGSVSGGCVEGAVAEEALAILKGGRPRLLSFGVADETAWDVGLACGGTIQVFVEALDAEIFPRIDSLLADEEAGAVATVVAGPEPLLGRKLLVTARGEHAGHIHPQLDADLRPALHEAIHGETPHAMPVRSPALELFVDVLLPPPTLVMIGGVHIAVSLATLAKTLGYRTLVVDPRQSFGSPERFPHVDRLIPQWPQDALAGVPLHQQTAVALLTHDPKIDDPALQIVLAGPAFYVGALGSQKTHAERVRRLRESGLSDAQIARIRSPIGLDIDARTPEEIALAIMAEIVAARHAHRQGKSS